MFFNRKINIIAETRINICKKCPQFNRNWCGMPLIPSHNTCGCYLPVKTKQNNQSCPQKKW